eukprot:TRINITY_DN4639_c0_g1_i2.p1 TRINITY_DN4639_c0_g1~~TRINITY_DN4639_c0_g1_i2.p1  ORF type:complete len:385 (-),score=63.70 TRINITY_DN4639_c0_g1_i2:91-1245(-)
MVRVGTLPMRLLTQRYGADITYSEEIIALKLRNCRRTVNHAIDTIDYLDTNGVVVYRTCEQDRPNILQMGSADAVSALAAATNVFPDVDGIDLNCGCPKHFSVQGGMGAALLSKPETIRDILTTLQRNLPTRNITCKLRLLATVAESAQLMQAVAKTNIPAVAIHARYISDRPRDPARWDFVRDVIQAANLDIPVIINGDIFKYEDFARVREHTGASSVMIARGAIRNPSIFSTAPLPLMEEVIPEYIKLAVATDNHILNTKYVVQQMMKEGLPDHRGDIFDRLNRVKNLEGICALWNLQDQFSALSVSRNRSRDSSFLGEQQQQQETLPAASAEVVSSVVVVGEKRLRDNDGGGDRSSTAGREVGEEGEPSSSRLCGGDSCTC